MDCMDAPSDPIDRTIPHTTHAKVVYWVTTARGRVLLCGSPLVRRKRESPGHASLDMSLSSDLLLPSPPKSSSSSASRSSVAPWPAGSEYLRKTRNKSQRNQLQRPKRGTNQHDVVDTIAQTGDISRCEQDRRGKAEETGQIKEVLQTWTYILL